MTSGASTLPLVQPIANVVVTAAPGMSRPVEAKIAGPPGGMRPFAAST